jgi:hypothetical protein
VVAVEVMAAVLFAEKNLFLVAAPMEVMGVVGEM